MSKSLLALTAALVATGCGSQHHDYETPVAPASPASDGSADQVAPSSDAPADSRPGAEGGSGSDASTTPDAPVDGPVVDAAACAARAVDAARGVFVALTGGSDASGDCGDQATPCRTIALGIAQAKKLLRPNVYVASGAYVESVQLIPGVTIEGGWSAATWAPDCSADATRIQTPADVDATSAARAAVEARDLGGKAVLRSLTILGKDAASVKPNESVYGVFATGATTQLELDDVVVRATSAASGASGTAGTAGASPAATCTDGDGLDGPAGDAAGAVAGQFTKDGYVPGDGSTGAEGTAGHAGTKAPDTGMMSCTVCIMNPTCSPLSSSISRPFYGTNGCGGGNGTGGGGGRGGGSSFGVYAWDATVSARNGLVQAGAAGNGGSGAGGGPGVAGSAGTANTELCGNACPSTTVPADCKPTGIVPTTQKGGDGGKGGSGGRGAGGSGGYSYAVFAKGAAPTIVGTALDHGAAGVGADGAPSGVAGDLGTN
jgi:hypothetical protein